MWTPEDERQNARKIMAKNIEQDRIGSKLTPEAREKAIVFAIDIWKGNMTNGKAAEIGIKHASGLK